MEQLKQMKQTLMSCVQGQLGNLQQADTKELGEAIDMIKDLEQAIYYHTVTKAMTEEKDNNRQNIHYYYTPMFGRYDPRFEEYPYKDRLAEGAYTMKETSPVLATAGNRS